MKPYHWVLAWCLVGTIAQHKPSTTPPALLINPTGTARHVGVWAAPWE
ncbi:MAG: hypothetical protein R2806_10470 [Saprospiraceae bacterium]